MEDIIIRRMRIEDAEAVTDVLIRSWQTAYRGIVSDECLDNMDRTTLIERRKKQYKDYIVAESDKGIVGFCWYMNDNSYSKELSDIDSEIVAIYVLPDLIREGIGKKMFSHAVEDLKGQGRKHMIIWCLKDNVNGRRFYEKMGGTMNGEHKIRIGNDDYDEVGYLFCL